jgi:hypothetical protein
MYLIVGAVDLSKTKMADADSLHDGNSDLDNDPHGMDADVEDDDVQGIKYDLWEAN